MAKSIRRTYTDAERAAYVAEFRRLHRAGGRTNASIARELGIPESNYYAWVAAGIKPASSAVKPAGKPRVIYAPEERERLAAEVERLHAGGQSIAAACRAVGIGEKSFRAWRAPCSAPLPMREVSITALVPALPAATIAVVAPGGYRVEGLDVENAARLLRALAC